MAAPNPQAATFVPSDENNSFQAFMRSLGEFSLNSFKIAMDPELATYMQALGTIAEDPTEGSIIHHEELKTTPLFSWPVKAFVGSTSSSASNSPQKGSSQASSTSSTSNVAQAAPASSAAFNQYAVLGSEIPATQAPPAGPSSNEIRPIFLNTDSPWSAFICGSQGSGKSYTLSCILENCLLNKEKIGRTPNPLTGYMFHYDTHATTACEAAHLATLLPVRVLVSPSNYWYLKELYESLPGTENRIQVFPLLLKEQHLNIQRMMRLMAFSDKDGNVPLYMEVIISILKQMAIEARGTHHGISYERFKQRVETETFARDQKGPLALRMQLLESFMETGPTAKAIPGNKKFDIFKASPGYLTIVDLSDPFVDPSSACVLFDICLSLFLEDRSGVAKVIALDEAHKFMTQSAASEVFTQKLLTVIREQRHKGARVIISTQEPTISPKLLDLCSMTFVHRFTSPDWLLTLRDHLAGASSNGRRKEEQEQLFKEIVNLNVGQSLLFAPSAMLDIVDGKIQKLGMAYMRFKTRPRLTGDGGKSVMAATIE